jgi:uncharacterized membrane protein YdbT with pleckstrin-like domain
MAIKSKNIKWKDRRRRMGLPLSFTRYALSDDRLFLQTGAFNLKDEEVVIYRVRDIGLKRTFWQRLCGVGTLVIQSSDKSMPKFEMKNIKKPTEVKEMLHEAVEDMKIKRRIRIGEYSTALLDDDDDDRDDDDDDDEDDDDR